MLVVHWQLHGDAQGHAARDDGHLVDGIGVGHHAGHQGVSGLVVGGVLLLLLREDHGPAFGPHQHLIFGGLEVRHHNLFAVLARRQQCRLVHQIGEVGPGKPRCAACQH